MRYTLILLLALPLLLLACGGDSTPARTPQPTTDTQTPPDDLDSTPTPTATPTPAPTATPTPTPTPAPTPEPDPRHIIQVRTDDGSRLNVRGGPGQGFDIIGKFRDGDYIIYLGDTIGNWHQVEGHSYLEDFPEWVAGWVWRGYTSVPELAFDGCWDIRTFEEYLPGLRFLSCYDFTPDVGTDSFTWLGTLDWGDEQVFFSGGAGIGGFGISWSSERTNSFSCQGFQECSQDMYADAEVLSRDTRIYISEDERYSYDGRSESVRYYHR